MEWKIILAVSSLFILVDCRTGKVCPKIQEDLFGTLIYNDAKTKVTYGCDPGYYLALMEGNSRTCKRTGKWTGAHGVCVREPTRTCNELFDPRNGKVTAQGQDVGDRATFRCSEGFLLEGSEEVQCMRGYKWSGTMPTCRSLKTAEDMANFMKDKFIDRYAASTVDSTSNDSAQGRLSVGKSGLDIIFAVDVSASIGEKSLIAAKKFMELIVNSFGLSHNKTDGTRIALLTFSSNVSVIFKLNDVSVRTKEQAIEKIKALKNSDGGTNIVKALQEIRKIDSYEKRNNKDRRTSDTNRAIFFITDAETTQDRKQIKQRAKELIDNRGYEIFAIGIGIKIDNFFLKDIASAPYLTHVFLLDRLTDLDKVVNIINEKNIDFNACGLASSGAAQPVNGQDTKKGAFPWVGWLSVFDDKGAHTCGGTLLCSRWFITAAHCVTTPYTDGENVKYNVTNPEKINVFLGDHDLGVNDGELLIKAKDVRIHPQYTGEMTQHGVRLYDVALLDLGEEDSKGTDDILNKIIRPICYPTNATDAEDKSVFIQSQTWFFGRELKRTGITIGWGMTPIVDMSTIQRWNVPQFNERSIWLSNKCSKRYPGIDEEMFFCVGGDDDRKECRGDIGGAFMEELQMKRYAIFGLALKTRECEKKGNFSIFLNLIEPRISDWVGGVLDGCNTNRDKYLDEVSAMQTDKQGEKKKESEEKKEKKREDEQEISGNNENKKNKTIDEEKERENEEIGNDVSKDNDKKDEKENKSNNGDKDKNNGGNKKKNKRKGGKGNKGNNKQRKNRDKNNQN